VSPAITGAWIGAALGFFSFVVLRVIANRVEKGEPSAGDPKKAAYAIRFAAFMDLMLFPVMGYFFGPLVLDA